MSMLLSKHYGVVIAIPDGRLDTNNSPAAEKQIVECITSGETKIAFDFSKTKYISSAGLRVILKTAKLLKQNQGAVVLCNANEQINEVLEISGFLAILKCVATLEEAITELSKA